MPPPKTIVENALERARRVVGGDVATIFDACTLRDVEHGAAELENELAHKDMLPNLRRLSRFFTKISTYARNATALFEDGLGVNWLWAPILQNLRLAADSFTILDQLIIEYKHVARALPEFRQFSQGLDAYEDQCVLAYIFTDILDIHIEIYTLLIKNGLSIFFETWWDESTPCLRQLQEQILEQSHLLLQGSPRHTPAEIRQRHERSYRDVKSSKQTQAMIQRNNVSVWLQLSTFEQDELLEHLQEQCHEGSCDWFYENSKVKSWIGHTLEHRVLWLKGKPGAGKSVLCAQLVKHLREFLHVPVFYFLCGSTTLQSQDARSLLKSLVWQVILWQPDVCGYVVKEFLQRNYQPSLVHLSKILTDLLSACARPRIIIDGLDEYNEKEQKSILTQVHYLSSGKSNLKTLKLLVSSQDLVVISRSLHTRSNIDLSEERAALQTAISIFVRSKIRDIHVFTQAGTVDDTQISLIEHTLLDKADGMFLWVRLVMSMLDHVYSLREMQSAVEDLPEGLDEVYDRIVEKLRQRTQAANFPQAIRILQWLTCCERPMKSFELLDAITLHPENTHVSKATKLFEHVFELCKPLVEIGSNGMVNFVHISVKDYFRTRSSLFTLLSARQVVTFSCLAYLTSACHLIDDYSNDTSRLCEVGRGHHGLCRYASAFWVEHLLAYAALAAQEQRLDSHDTVIKAANALAATLVTSSFGQRSASSDTILDSRCALLARHEPALHLVRTTLTAQLGTKIAPRNDSNRVISTDPFIAMREQYDTLARQLLQLESVPGLTSTELRAFRKIYGSSVLICRKNDCAQGMLSFNTLEERDAHEATHQLLCPQPQCYNHRKGFKTIAKLNSHLREFHPQQKESVTTLRHPGQSTTDSEIQSRVKHRTQTLPDTIIRIAKPDSQNNPPPDPPVYTRKASNLSQVLNDPPPLFTSQYSGAAGIETRHRPTQRAESTFFYLETADVPLDPSTPSDWQDRHGRTPLARACYSGDLAAVWACLTERPQDLNLADAAGDTPLHIAVSVGAVKIVDVLLQSICDMDSRNKNLDTPLMRAVRDKDIEVMKLLLSYGADPFRRDFQGDALYNLVPKDDENYSVIRRQLIEAREQVISMAEETAYPKYELLAQAYTRDRSRRFTYGNDLLGVAATMMTLSQAEAGSLDAAVGAAEEDVLGFLLGSEVLSLIQSETKNHLDISDEDTDKDLREEIEVSKWGFDKYVAVGAPHQHVSQPRKSSDMLRNAPETVQQDSSGTVQDNVVQVWYRNRYLPNQYICNFPKCRRPTNGFSSRTDLNHHLRREHSIDIGGKSLFKCSIIGCEQVLGNIWDREDGFRAHVFEMHFEIHHGIEAEVDRIVTASILQPEPFPSSVTPLPTSDTTNPSHSISSPYPAVPQKLVQNPQNPERANGDDLDGAGMFDDLEWMEWHDGVDDGVNWEFFDNL